MIKKFKALFHMQLFFDLVIKILPLYGIMMLGYIAGQYMKVEKDTIARMLLYILSPIIIFHGVYTTVIDRGGVILPIYFYVLACSLSLIAYAIGSMVWKDSTKNIFAYTAATGNTGYFGIPVALALLGEESLGFVVLSTMGLVLFENSLGFFMTARGSFTAKESLRRVLILPSVYAFIIGLALNLGHITPPEWYSVIAGNFRGAYTILGSMMAGLGLAGFKKLSIDWKFLGLCFFSKFILYPAIAIGTVLLDMNVVHLFTPIMRQVIILLSLTPMAVNTVVLATALKVKPEKAALGVLSTTLFALFYIPMVMTLMRYATVQ